eukprot:3867095-Rhodomonas_salina.1
MGLGSIEEMGGQVVLGDWRRVGTSGMFANSFFHSTLWLTRTGGLLFLSNRLANKVHRPVFLCLTCLWVCLFFCASHAIESSAKELSRACSFAFMQIGGFCRTRLNRDSRLSNVKAGVLLCPGRGGAWGVTGADSAWWS